MHENYLGIAPVMLMTVRFAVTDVCGKFCIIKFLFKLTFLRNRVDQSISIKS